MASDLVHSYILASIGSVIMVIAYALNLFGTWSSNSFWYSFLNAVGGGLNVAGSVVIKTWPFVVLYGVWTLVGVYGCFQWSFVQGKRIFYRCSNDKDILPKQENK